MPLGTDEAREAKQEYLRLFQELQDENIQRSEIRRVETLTGQARKDEIRRISRGNAEQAAALESLANSYDAKRKAENALEKAKVAGDISADDLASAEAAYFDAMDAHNRAFQKVLAGNVNTEQLGQMLELYVSEREKGAIPKVEREERQKDFQEQLQQLQQRHPARWARIEKVVNVYRDWTEKRTGLDDPADLKRLVARAGVLEFRITATMPQSSRGPKLSPAQFQYYLGQLAEQGPLAGRSRNEDFQWFEIRGTGERFATDVVLGRYAGKRYILLCNRRGLTMLQDPTRPTWSLRAYPTTDQLGYPAVGFYV